MLQYGTFVNASLALHERAVQTGGFEGGLTNRKYAGMTHDSRATAQRELSELVQKGILRPNPGGGRSTSYDLYWDEISG